jgi:hypothetical protein
MIGRRQVKHGGCASVEGEQRGWDLLAAVEPGDVCERAAVVQDEGGSFVVPVLGSSIVVDPVGRTITGSSLESTFVLTKTAYFSRLSILYYLTGAKNVPLSGRLLGPAELKAGQFFAGGSHRLPLDRIATRFGDDPDGFLAQAAAFGGIRREYGDAAVELWPLPRVPVTLILWRHDEEFPARSYLLFDETCELHLAADIVWSVAMMCVLVMLR